MPRAIFLGFDPKFSSFLELNWIIVSKLLLDSVLQRERGLLLFLSLALCLAGSAVPGDGSDFPGLGPAVRHRGRGGGGVSPEVVFGRSSSPQALALRRGSAREGKPCWGEVDKAAEDQESPTNFLDHLRGGLNYSYIGIKDRRLQLHCPCLPPSTRSKSVS